MTEGVNNFDKQSINWLLSQEQQIDVRFNQLIRLVSPRVEECDKYKRRVNLQLSLYK